MIPVFDVQPRRRVGSFGVVASYEVEFGPHAAELLALVVGHEEDVSGELERVDAAGVAVVEVHLVDEDVEEAARVGLELEVAIEVLQLQFLPGLEGGLVELEDPDPVAQVELESRRK